MHIVGKKKKNEQIPFCPEPTTWPELGGKILTFDKIY